MRPTMIVVHHSATKDSGTVSWGAIRRYHLETMKLIDIGYHAGIELVGSVYVVQQGRALDKPGAHTKGQNSRSLGFCFVGDYDAVAPAPEMLQQAARLVLAPWCRQFGLTAGDIHPHSKFAPKTCPGTKFDLPRLRELVSAAIKELP